MRKKIIHHESEDGIEESVPRDHRLSSHGKPRDANRWSSVRIFLSLVMPIADPQDGFFYPILTHDGFSVHRDHCLSSLGKPHDANQLSSGQTFLSHTYTHDGFSYS